MKKRLLAIFLSVCTLIGAVPSLILAAQDIIIFDPVEPSTSGNDILKLIEQAAPDVPDGTLTPYGTGSLIKLIEKKRAFHKFEQFKGHLLQQQGR